MRLLLLIVFISLFAKAEAQIPKGSILLGGSLSFNTNNSGTNAFTITTQYGKAYKANSFFGFQAGYGHNHPGINVNWNYYSGGIFYRKYVPVVKELYFFGEGGLDINYSKLSSSSSNPATKGVERNYTISAALMPGLSYAVSSKLHLEIAFPDVVRLYYQQQKRTTTTSGVTYSTKTNGFGLNSSTSLNSFSNIQFGFRLLLQKKSTN